MKKIGRNDLCHCGSGKKFKKCCANVPPKKMDLGDIPHGARLKGGVAFDPENGGFYTVLHIWDNPDCIGEPQEVRSPTVFASEQEAWHYYNSTVRPQLNELADQVKRDNPEAEISRTELL